MRSEISLLTQFHVVLIRYFRTLFSNLIYCNYSLYNAEIVLVIASLILQTRRPLEVTAPWYCLLRKNTHKV